MHLYGTQGIGEVAKYAYIAQAYATPSDVGGPDEILEMTVSVTPNTAAKKVTDEYTVVDNGDGTYSLAYTLSEEPLKSGILGLIDEQHLLFTGSGYTPLKLYYTEEVWVEGGGSMEVVRTSIWKNDGSVGAASWSGSPYRFAPDFNSTGEEIYAIEGLYPDGRRVTYSLVQPR